MHLNSRAYRLSRAVLLAVLLGAVPSLAAAPAAVVPDLAIRRLTTVAGAEPVRLTRDPTDGALYYLRRNGEIHRLNINPGVDTSTSTLVYSSAHHGLSATLGFTIGPDGTFYLVGNQDVVANVSTRALFRKGTPSGGGHVWSSMAETVAYARSRTAFDHYFTSLQVTSDGLHLLASSGSRTDHGEIQTNGGAFPGVREQALTAVILKLPVSASGLVLENDRDWLVAGGYLFCEGVRNNFDLAYGPSGRLFGTENGPDRDMSEELNWYREGHHYGFPWRLGGTDNPQQFPGYDPAADRLLDYRFTAVRNGFFHNDPTFPAPPGPFTEPILNLGPDADQYREPVKGAVLDASARGEAVATLTAHRSPLGLVFDNAAAIGAPYTGDGFVLSWTGGDPWGNGVAGPFLDASGDLLHVRLEPLPDDSNYTARITRVVEGFANPIDAEIVGRRIYVLEYGSPRGIYEITFPENSPRILIQPPVIAVPEGGTSAVQVALSAPPGGPVTVSVAHAGGDADLSVAGGGTLHFTDANWDTSQTLTLAAAADTDAESGRATFTASAAGYQPASLFADEVDAQAPPAPWNTQDIGAVSLAGSATHAAGTFTLQGAGTGVAGTADEFRGVFRPLHGDGEIRARIVSLDNTGTDARAGVMLRESRLPGSRHAFSAVQANGSVRFRRRNTNNGSTANTTVTTVTFPHWVRLVRAGNTWSAYRSADGSDWTLTGSATFDMARTVYAGLVAADDNDAELTTAVFDNVTVAEVNTPPTLAGPGEQISPHSTPLGPLAVTVGDIETAPAALVLSATSDNPALIPDANLVLGGAGAARTITLHPLPGLGGVAHITLAVSDGTASTSQSFMVTVVGPALPPGWSSLDIGVTPAGSAEESGGVFTVSGGGTLWGTADGLRFVHQPLSGDGEIIARVTSHGASPPWARAGVMIRETLLPNSRHAFMTVSAGFGFAFQRRTATGGASFSDSGGPLHPAPDNWVRLTRQGNTVRGWKSADGVDWTLVRVINLGMASEAHIGLAVTSYASPDLNTATFDNVLVVP